MFHKFRAWDAANKQMIYYTWEELIDAAVSTELCNHVISENIHELIRISEYDYSEQMRMQCIGATDMNGKDIYVGDILRKEICSPDDMAFGYYGDIGVVKYDSSVIGFIIDNVDTGDDGFYDSRGMNFSFDGIEIVGNIYENPEIL